MQRVQRDYTNKIFTILAESPKPLSPYSIQKNWKSLLLKFGDSYQQEQMQTNPAYPRILEAIKKLRTEGYIELKKADENGSEKRAKITYYGLAFKGALKYLAQFYEAHLDGSLSSRTEKLLLFIERQGTLFNYPPFQECRWLDEHDDTAIIVFIHLAREMLFKQRLVFGGGDATIEEIIKRIQDPNDKYHNLGIKCIINLRKGENEELMFDFGWHYFRYTFAFANEETLVWMGKEGANKKLSEFAKYILSEKQKDIRILENAARLLAPIS
jgi:hypothetical protein